MPKYRNYDEVKLRKLWPNSSLSLGQIASLLGLPRSTLRTIAVRLGLPSRENIYNHQRDDPTAEEIAQRAAECRLKHYKEKRAEPYYKNPPPGALRCFSYCGQCYVSTPSLT
jgi:hypothetical protein